MPSFDVQWGKGVQVLPFDDPDGDLPGRLNPRQNHPPLHSVMQFDPASAFGPGGGLNRHVTMRAIVDGVVAPRDSELPPGTAFHCRVLEWPHGHLAPLPSGVSHPGPHHERVMPYPHRFWHPCDRSSVQSLRIVHAGHYTICMVRGGGKGRVILHLSVEDA